MRILLLCFGLLIAFMITLNAAFMLVSPRAWFRLPDWLRAKGSVSESRYSTGRGALEVRFLGGVILAGIFSVIYDLVVSS